jgi:hypothetical protein
MSVSIERGTRGREAGARGDETDLDHSPLRARDGRERAIRRGAVRGKWVASARKRDHDGFGSERANEHNLGLPLMAEGER